MNGNGWVGLGFNICFIKTLCDMADLFIADHREWARVCTKILYGIPSFFLPPSYSNHTHNRPQNLTPPPCARKTPYLTKP